MPQVKKKLPSLIFGLVVISIIGLLLATGLELINGDDSSEVYSSVKRNTQADLLLKEGLVHLSKTHNSQAKKAFTEAIAINPNLAEAYNNLGIVYYRQRKDRQAIASFKQAITLNPNYHVAYYNSIWLLYNHQYFTEWREIIQSKHEYRNSNSPPEYSFALIASSLNDNDVAYITREFRSVVKQQPDKAKSHLNLGLILEIQGNVREAISEYKKAVKLSPSLAQGHDRLGHIFRNMNRPRPALNHLRKAKELYLQGRKPYGFWKTEQLIESIQNNARTGNFVEFDSDLLIKTDFLEDRPKLSQDEIYRLVSPAVTCIIPHLQFSSQAGLTLSPAKILNCRAGMNLTEDGYILTNAHNIKKSDRVTVIFKDGREFTGRVSDRGSNLDLALIKLDEAENLPTVTWASTKHANRDSELDLVNHNAVYALGFKRFEPWKINQGKVLKMNISEVYQRPKKSIFVTSQDFVSFGYSGGPLINSYGQVIGITFAKRKSTGEGLHLSVNTVKEYIDRIVLTERIRRDFDDKYAELLMKSKQNRR